jgi:YVTN family beta-propeller protein
VDYQPSGVAVNPARGRVYVASRSEDRLLVIDSHNEVTARLPAPGGPRGIAVNQRENLIYVAAREQNTVLVFDGDTNTMTRQIIVGKAPTAVAVNPATGWLYVLNSGDNTISVINGRNTEATVQLGESAQDLAVDPGLNRLYVTCYGSGTLKTIDGTSNEILATTPTGQGASGVDINRESHRVYVANADSNTLSIIDGVTNSIISTLPIGEFPQCVAVNSNTNHVYIGSAASHTVTIVDGKQGTVLSILDAGISPTALAVNPNSYRVYAVSDGSNSLLCIKDLPNQLPQGIPVLQGVPTPVQNGFPNSSPVVSDEQRAAIDALLSSIVGLTARKKYSDAHRMITDTQKKFGPSLELAQIEAMVLTQEGQPDKARLLLQNWIPAIVSMQGGTSSTVMSVTNPNLQAENSSALRPGQATIPVGTHLEMPKPAPRPERLPVSLEVPGATLATIFGTDEYLGMEKEMLDSVNELRRAAGLSPVIWDSKLADGSRAHSVDMRDKNYFAHESPSPALHSMSDRYTAIFGQWNCAVSENIMHANTGGARLDSNFVESASNKLAHSESHKAVMLDPRWTRGGIGIATDEKGGLWITQMFASTPRK